MHEPIAQLALVAAALGADAAPAPAGEFGVTDIAVSRVFALIPFLPLLGTVLCGVCAAMKIRTKLPAWIAVGSLSLSFVLTVFLAIEVLGADAQGTKAGIIRAFDWINFAWGPGAGQSLIANFSFYADPLTVLWMLFVTGLATLIALYASEYMSHDVGPGYCRFFAAFCLFVFSMACLVMGDNLLLLFLGWEGVGLCSYLLIGYFYKKPSAVAAAKKAFIMNRIGDLGLSLGVMLAFVQFGSLEYSVIFSSPELEGWLAAAQEGRFGDIPFTVQLIPILLAVGAFGKSAQLPLYVWLPDAMEGPTPVSALIHAATMVTAGVYLVARMLPIFQVSELALPLVAIVGTLTALLAATIGMAQFDIKRIMAYSTVSQLGYMFAGLGVLGAAASADAASAGPFHVLTHAFFKATLFLCCGAVMHGFAGQLDLRKLSGVSYMKGWGIVGIAMFIGCLNLAGFPFTAGYFSKDMILAETFVSGGLNAVLGVILLFTAGLTAYYTFRVFFRVFVGPKHFEPGDELHGDDDHAHDAAGHETRDDSLHDKAQAEHAAHPQGGSDAHGHSEHDFHPHPPGWAINTVLVVLAVASVLAALLYPIHWVNDLIAGSTTSMGAGVSAEHAHHAHGTLLGFDPHKIMYYVSAGIGAIGILVAALLHGPKGITGLIIGSRTRADVALADKLVPPIAPLARAAQGKWFVDEIYNFLFVKPVWLVSHLFAIIDKILVDGLVDLFGWLPRLIGSGARRSQRGVLHDYALRMAAGVCLIVLLVLLFTLVSRGGDGTGAGDASAVAAAEPDIAQGVTR